MARSIRSAPLETRSARMKLAKRGKPYWARLARGLSLGYRRINTAGPWIVRSSDGKGRNRIQNFATADDYEESNGDSVLTYWEAQAAARSIANGGKVSGRAITVDAAIDRYADELRANGGNPYNAALARLHLPSALRSKAVQLLTEDELRQWRNSLLDGRAKATVNRIVTVLSAALSLAARLDRRITNRAWVEGLRKLHGANVGRARNVVLTPAQIRKLVALAYDVSPQFGVFVETAAETGARRSQLSRLLVSDLQDDRADPRLLMPGALKGKKGKRIERRPVAIPVGLAVTLHRAADQRPGNAPLLLKEDGSTWGASDPRVPFRDVVERVGLDPDTVTMYSLRHSSITRQLLSGVPVRVVAASHDTSTTMIEASYSSLIGDHSDALVRRSLLDLGAPPATNVVPLPPKAGRSGA